MMQHRSAVDLRQPEDLAVAVSVGHAWRELRRGAGAIAVRNYLFGRGETALDAGQLDTLDVLVQRPSWRMSELAEALRVDPSTATRAFQRLSRIKLAQRSEAHVDGRVVMVEATEAGRVRHDDIDRRRALVLTRLLSAFEPDERAALASLLTRFVEELDVAVSEASAAALATAKAAAANAEGNG